MSRMSEAALSRCRNLTIQPHETGWKLIVTDPRVGNKVMAVYIARTLQDLQRSKLAYMKSFRIPEENVTILEDSNADKADRKSPPVHESRL